MAIEYKNDQKTSGIQTFDNGDTYAGDFLNGKKHGHGLLKTPTKRSYDGEWEDDLPHGYGMNTFPNGKVYRGEFRKGKPFGDGQWTYSDGRTYTGKWIKGEFINEENRKDTMEFRLVTSIINFLAITFMLAVVVYWGMNVLNII